MVYGYDRHMVYFCMGYRSVSYYTATRLCFVMISMLVSPYLHPQNFVAEPSDNRGKKQFLYSIVHAYISLLMLYFSRCSSSHFRFLGQVEAGNSVPSSLLCDCLIADQFDEAVRMRDGYRFRPRAGSYVSWLVGASESAEYCVAKTTSVLHGVSEWRIV